MHSDNNKLTSAEISHLWNSYVFDSLIYHLFSYFLSNIEDKEIKEYLDYSHCSIKQHLDEYSTIFNDEELPVPRGTIAEDVNTNTPRLFSDKFYILYGEEMAKFALSNFALAYTESSRDDIRNLFNKRLDEIVKVHQQVIDILISKGIYSKPPYINVSNHVEFIEDKHFFAGVFGEIRNLSSLEVKQLFNNTISNTLGKALIMGFSQVSKSKEIQEYFLRGKKISDGYIKLFSEKLLNDGINPPCSLESEILPFSGSESPLSERLMLNHTVFLNAFGIANYGLSLAQSQRHDLSTMYAKIIVEVGLYTDDGADLLIKNKWLEQPPLTLDRKK